MDGGGAGELVEWGGRSSAGGAEPGEGVVAVG